MQQRGQLEHLVTVQKQKSGNDPFSELVDDWEDVRQERFSLEPLKGEEFERAQQVQSTTTHEGRCHKFDGANSEMRLKYGTRIFNVESVVNEKEQNRFLVWRLAEVA